MVNPHIINIYEYLFVILRNLSFFYLQLTHKTGATIFYYLDFNYLILYNLKLGKKINKIKFYD